MVRKVVQLWKVASGTIRVTRVGQAGAWIPQLVKEGMDHGIDSGETLCGSVFEQLGDEIDGIRISLAEDLEQ